MGPRPVLVTDLTAVPPDYAPPESRHPHLERFRHEISAAMCLTAAYPIGAMDRDAFEAKLRELGVENAVVIGREKAIAAIERGPRPRTLAWFAAVLSDERAGSSAPLNGASSAAKDLRRGVAAPSDHSKFKGGVRAL